MLDFTISICSHMRCGYGIKSMSVQLKPVCMKLLPDIQGELRRTATCCLQVRSSSQLSGCCCLARQQDRGCPSRWSPSAPQKQHLTCRAYTYHHAWPVKSCLGRGQPGIVPGFLMPKDVVFSFLVSFLMFRLWGMQQGNMDNMIISGVMA